MTDMTDPFFKTQKPQPTQNIDQWNVPWDNQIQVILHQQKEIEENFQKLKNLFADPNVTLEQKTQIKEKLLELKAIYSKNKTTLSTLQTAQTSTQDNQNSQNTAQGNVTENTTAPTVHVNKINAVEDGTKRTGFSVRNFFIWCGVLFLLLIWWVAFLFYYMITHPAELKNIGMAPENVKSLLQTFTVVFFGILTLLGFIFLVVNVYRIFTSKRKPKIWYFVGILFALLLLWWGIVWGTSIIKKVNEISVDKILNNNNFIRPYLWIKDKQEYIGNSEYIILWPTQIGFALNVDLFNKQIAPKIPWKITSLLLSCGNGQQLQKNPKNEWFLWKCFYRDAKEWGYPLAIHVGYRTQNTSEQLTQSFDLGNFLVHGTIKISDANKTLLNTMGENEIQWGIAGDVLTFDASEVFTKLWLQNYTISWDFDGDGIIDRENSTKATYRYTKAGVYYVSVRFPDLNSVLYSFPIRIEQSEVPIWNIVSNHLWKDNYHFVVEFFENTRPITQYIFQVLNEKGEIITSKETGIQEYTYTFSKPWTYRIKALFVTEDNTQGTILSDPIVVEDISANFDIKISKKFINQEDFEHAEVVSSGEHVSVTITEIPSILKVTLNKSAMERKWYIVSAKHNTQPVIFLDDTFKVKIDDDMKKNVIFLTARHKSTNTSINQKIIVHVKREGIIGKLSISPDTVGTSPFVVRFDASTSQVHDPDDEIIYFTWDFGDGKRNIKRNTSDAIVEHTYHYNEKKNNGEFHPQLRVKTKKGKEYDIFPDSPILVKQPLRELDITIDSHPSQRAKIWDIVQFSLQLDGLPQKIYWDFGNGQKTECTWRACVETKKVYQEAWTYKIKVKVEYTNRIPLEGNITLKVQ